VSTDDPTDAAQGGASDGPTERTLRVEGVVDFLSAPDMQRSGVEVLTDPGVTALTIDLGAVTFIDSSGLSVLVYLRGRCDERGVELRLRNVPSRARSLIDSLGLSTYFELPPS
jgi:anti-anti-sigma factor